MDFAMTGEGNHNEAKSKTEKKTGERDIGVPSIKKEGLLIIHFKYL